MGHGGHMHRVFFGFTKQHFHIPAFSGVDKILEFIEINVKRTAPMNVNVGPGKGSQLKLGEKQTPKNKSVAFQLSFGDIQDYPASIVHRPSKIKRTSCLAEHISDILIGQEFGNFV